jgi:ABC-type Fe3+-citrate transport system substrate-binding protein
MKGRVIDKLGISEERLAEMVKRVSELAEKLKNPHAGTSDLIKLIAKERSFTRTECVYLGIILAATWENDGDY